MSDQKPEEPAKLEPSRTARNYKSALGLGRTQGQGSAEILAGMRADREPNPEHNALANSPGRVTARIVEGLGKQQAKSDYVFVRPYLFRKLIEPVIAASQRAHVIVELASGFAPNGLYMARQFPHIQYIEIDLPGVVAEKQDRLKKAGIAIPPNLSWRQADLGVEPLAEVLNGQQVDVVMAQGLMMYFDPIEMQRIAQYVANCLLPQGIFVFDVGSEEGVKTMSKVQNSLDFFQRQSGQFLGILKDEAQVRQVFKGAGYALINAYRPTDLAPQIAGEVSVVPSPDWDIALLVVARKGPVERAVTDPVPIDPSPTVAAP